MLRLSRLSPALIGSVCFAVVPLAARAQTVPPECKALIDAELKVITTPHHMYLTQSSGNQGAESTTGEAIYVDGVDYLFTDGKWMRSPISAQDELDQVRETIKNVKVMSCRREGDESVGGVAAVVYTSHDENADAKSDARVWVAKSSGLPLRTDEVIDSGMGGKMHMSIRYEFANVHAPQVQ